MVHVLVSNLRHKAVTMYQHQVADPGGTLILLLVPAASLALTADQLPAVVPADLLVPVLPDLTG